jgi:PDZ domain-containing secreted protein
MAVSISWNTTFRDRVRLLAGIEQEEVDNSTMDMLANIAAEWFNENTSSTFVTNSDAAYDNAVMYYSCYLGSIAQNGMGIEQLRIGDIFVQYVDDEPYQKYLELANEAIIAKQALSIKTSTYNANAATGDVDWKKNIDGSDSTLNVRQKPRGM